MSQFTSYTKLISFWGWPELEKSNFLKETLDLIKSLCALEEQAFALRTCLCLAVEIARKKERRLKMETSLQSAKPDILIPWFSQYFLVDQPLGPKQILIYLFCFCLCLWKLQAAFNYPWPTLTIWRYWSENRKSVKQLQWDFICTVMTFDMYS